MKAMWAEVNQIRLLVKWEREDIDRLVFIVGKLIQMNTTVSEDLKKFIDTLEKQRKKLEWYDQVTKLKCMSSTEK